MPESHREQISRVSQMAGGSDTWDLSDNDTAALQTVLRERRELLESLKEVVALSDRKTNVWDKAHAAIAKAEGR